MTLYDADFYDLVTDGAVASAEAVAPIVCELLGTPSTVADIGCGAGAWALAFRDLGCSVAGYDTGEGAGRLIPEHFTQLDLAEPFTIAPVDLAVCLEVAEHLPEPRAAGLVADLCATAPTVLFSAAVPSQGGVGHVNERWPSYWAEKFAAHGFAVSGGLRWVIWNDGRVENWYRQNLLVATREPSGPLFTDDPWNLPLPVIHPVLWRSRT